jgi:Na+-transporting methylmalonyl-CoA/oxaloacetate decarboxylase gamma subunit
MKKTILAVIGAIVVVVILFVVAVVGGMTYFVRTHMHAQEASADTAHDEFAKARERFAGQHPMIERSTGPNEDDDERFVVHRPEASAQPVELQALRALAYDRRQQRLVHVNVPFWLLRMAPSGRGFSFMQDTDIDMGRTHITVEDLQRHGPGLILDSRSRRGADVLVWVE